MNKYIQRILDAYNPDGPGRDWYATQHLVGHGSREQLACVAAVLSPGVHWDTVLRYLPAVTEALHKGQAAEGPFYRAGLAKCVRVYQAGRSALPLTGAPKTARFARNLMGDLGLVTIDRWMERLLGFKVSTPAAYLRAERYFVEAAAIVGIAPAELQAMVWVSVRDGVEA